MLAFLSTFQSRFATPGGFLAVGIAPFGRVRHHTYVVLAAVQRLQDWAPKPRWFYGIT